MKECSQKDQLLAQIVSLTKIRNQLQLLLLEKKRTNSTQKNGSVF